MRGARTMVRMHLWGRAPALGSDLPSGLLLKAPEPSHNPPVLDAHTAMVPNENRSKTIPLHCLECCPGDAHDRSAWLDAARSL